MSIRLSVNLNKVALLRNSRDTDIPSPVEAAITAIEAGARGITVHPRPDLRHIRPADVHALAELLAKPEYRDIEFNIEGNPFAGAEENGYPGFMALAAAARPDQCTLVPDDPDQLTSDHGWDLSGDSGRLRAALQKLQADGARVSCFMDPDPEQLTLAAGLGADCIEFYTGPWAERHGSPEGDVALAAFAAAAQHAASLGLGVNAGHDLNQNNLARFCREVPNLLEVSIGHAIMADALWLGLAETVRRYRRILDNP